MGRGQRVKRNTLLELISRNANMCSTISMEMSDIISIIIIAKLVIICRREQSCFGGMLRFRPIDLERAKRPSQEQSRLERLRGYACRIASS